MTTRTQARTAIVLNHFERNALHQVALENLNIGGDTVFNYRGEGGDYVQWLPPARSRVDFATRVLDAIGWAQADDRDQFEIPADLVPVAIEYVREWRDDSLGEIERNETFRQEVIAGVPGAFYLGQSQQESRVTCDKQLTRLRREVKDWNALLCRLEA